MLPLILNYTNLKPSGSQPGVVYGLCKVHKGSDGQSPPFRPILSAINTPSYKIAKFLVPMLPELTKNQNVSEDSFESAKNVREQNPDLFVSSFDIDSLFTNVPLLKNFSCPLLTSIHFLLMFLC